MTGVIKVWVATVVIRVLEAARAGWRFLTRRHTTDPTPADWAYTDSRPLDERDIELWIDQLRGPQANEQIHRELSA